MAKDFLGNELNIGDKVEYYCKYRREFKKGKIKKISPKMLYLEVDRIGRYFDILRQRHEQVTKIEKK
jgi:hypothetical protein